MLLVMILTFFLHLFGYNNQPAVDTQAQALTQAQTQEFFAQGKNQLAGISNISNILSAKTTKAKKTKTAKATKTKAAKATKVKDTKSTTKTPRTTADKSSTPKLKPLKSPKPLKITIPKLVPIPKTNSRYSLGDALL